MSKLVNDLKRADEERSNAISPSEKNAQIFVKNTLFKIKSLFLQKFNN